MTSNTQLISLSISFLYGIIFYYFTIINFKIIDSMNIHIKHFITSIYVLDIAVIYAIIIYKINNGYFHLYFLVLVILGYFVGYLTNKIYFSKINVKLNIFKLKK